MKRLKDFTPWLGWCVAGAMVCMGAGQKTPDQVAFKEVRIRDTEGRTRVLIDKNGMFLLDANKVTRLLVMLDDDSSPSVTLMDVKKNVVAELVPR